MIDFETKFGKTIIEMKRYLEKNNLSMINFHYEDGWKFRMSKPKRVRK